MNPYKHTLPGDRPIIDKIDGSSDEAKEAERI
jgi:hypothetical protein